MAFGWPFHGEMYVAGVGVGHVEAAILAGLAAAVGTRVGFGQFDLG